MKIINVEHPPKKYWLGRKREKNFRPVPINAQAWLDQYPGTTVAVIYRRPDGVTFPVATSTVGEFEWLPKPDATAVAGEGKLEIHLMRGDEMLGISAMVKVTVDESLADYDDSEIPETPSWVDEVVQDVTEQADRAEAAVSHYPQIVNGVWYVWDAETGEFVSTGISAQGEDGVSPTVTVTAIEGGHRVTITDADGAHTFDVMDGEGGSGSGAVESVNGMTGAVVLGAADVGAVDSTTYASDMGQVHTELTGKLSVGDLGTALDDVGGITYVLTVNGTTVTLDRPFIAVSTSLLSTARRVMFVVILAESGGDPVEFLNLTPTLLDTSNRQLWLEGIYDGSRYTAELTAASVSSTMTGTLVVEPIVTQSDIPTAVSELTNDSGFQTASDVQTAISGVRQLPTVTASDNGKFLRVVNGTWAAETVPAAEGSAF